MTSSFDTILGKSRRLIWLLPFYLSPRDQKTGHLVFCQKSRFSTQTERSGSYKDVTSCRSLGWLREPISVPKPNPSQQISRSKRMTRVKDDIILLHPTDLHQRQVPIILDRNKKVTRPGPISLFTWTGYRSETFLEVRTVHLTRDRGGVVQVNLSHQRFTTVTHETRPGVGRIERNGDISVHRFY